MPKPLDVSCDEPCLELEGCEVFNDKAHTVSKSSLDAGYQTQPLVLRETLYRQRAVRGLVDVGLSEIASKTRMGSVKTYLQSEDQCWSI